MSAVHVTHYPSDTSDYEELLERYARARAEAEALAERELEAELKKQENALWQSVVVRRYKLPKHSKDQ